MMQSLTIVCCCICVLGALLPPTDFDVREYHLQVPKEWYQAGKIGFLEHNVYGNMPLGSELHSLSPMILWPDDSSWLWGAIAGKTMMSFYAIATALLLIAAGNRLGRSEGGWFAAAVFLSTPWVIKTAFEGWNENAYGFYFLASGYLMLMAISAARPSLERVDWRMLGLTGFMAGAAISCKYPAALFVAVPLTLLATIMPTLVRWFSSGEDQAPPAVADRNPNRRSISKPSLQFSWKAGAVVTVACLLSAGPWFGKNLLQSGNPTYPLLAEWFGGREAEQIDRWNRAHRMTDPGGYSASRLLNDLDNTAVGSKWLNWSLVPFALLSLFVAYQKRQVWVVVGVLLFGLASWWLVTHRIDRFLVPLYPLLGWLCIWGIGSLKHPGHRIGAMVYAAVGIFISLIIATAPLPAHVLLGDTRFLASYDRLLSVEEGNAIARVHAELNRRVAANQRVLLVGDAVPFDIEVDVLYNTCFDGCRFERLAKDKRPDEVHAALVDSRISHLFIDWNSLARYRAPGNYGYSDFVTPEVVQPMIDAGVLVPIPLAGIPEEYGQLFEVRSVE